eukprot:CAMPEP_0197184644 /NCGR_PEP_ID=MMETSP1423-20130617/10262_1 /TAXON_ID=476441 /ORGANISM="Pseudo-nitzschia heimii, Strain UNC1101" /LENGTH=562 /DNA_ID=CAMNT_0042635515 /DNA_START=66 /DNA_END=1754 /DNA_ORIENTATION=-
MTPLLLLRLTVAIAVVLLEAHRSNAFVARNTANFLETAASARHSAAANTITQRFVAASGDVTTATNVGDGLRIAVVGSGPSGLLLSNLLLGSDKESHQITLFDGRSDPRTNQLDGRAYALGIGMRGRTAIQSADPAIWEAVKARGFESSRFNVHIGVSSEKDLVVPLRSDSKVPRDSPNYVEPSVLLYQSELCASLLTELEEDPNKKNNLSFNFNARVVDCDLDTMKIRTATKSTDESITEDEFGPFDLIVGCDGVNSVVRASIDGAFPEFDTTREKIPGFTKVVRLDAPVGAPSDDGQDVYDPKSVCILLPSGAFIEPVGDDGSCCILFSGRGGGPDQADTSGLPAYLKETSNATAVEEALRDRFPRWRDDALPGIAEQLMAQDLASNSAYSVTCNTYHYRNKAVLLGDAAHATGGVSGQGVNSALVDAKVLAESLRSRESLGDALLAYSRKQVPEGKALYDLSFGPKPQGLKKKLLWGVKTIRDAIFQGRLGIGEDTLQTRLSSELTPFATVRRERDYFYTNDDVEEFSSDEEFRRQIEALHEFAPAVDEADVKQELVVR